MALVEMPDEPIGVLLIQGFCLVYRNLGYIDMFVNDKHGIFLL